MPLHGYSIYTDLYLDINNCGRGMLKFKDWEAVQIYRILCSAAVPLFLLPFSNPWYREPKLSKQILASEAKP